MARKPFCVEEAEPANCICRDRCGSFYSPHPTSQFNATDRSWHLRDTGFFIFDDRFRHQPCVPSCAKSGWGIQAFNHIFQIAKE